MAYNFELNQNTPTYVGGNVSTWLLAFTYSVEA